MVLDLILSYLISWFARAWPCFYSLPPSRSGEVRVIDMESVAADGPVINCIMLVTWPQRGQMTHEALVSFVCQDHTNRVLTVVNDGAPCRLTSAFHARCRGSVLQVPPGTTIGEKRNAGAQAVAADYLASFDDDDFSLPGRLSDHLACIGDAIWLSAGRKYIALHQLDNIIGFEYGRCFGAGMISAEVTRRLSWPALNWCERAEATHGICTESARGIYTASARGIRTASARGICIAYALHTHCIRTACGHCMHATLHACALQLGVRTRSFTRLQRRTPSSAVGRDLVLGRGRPPMAASLRQTSSTTFTGGIRLSTAPSVWCRAPRPCVTLASWGCQHRLLLRPRVAPGWGPPAAWAPLGGGCPACVTEPAACDVRRHETNASVAHRQSLWQGVMPLQLAGGEAVAAPAQVVSLLQQHAGEVYLEAVVEVVAEA
jgi:hypothetical protein